ncbi:MAG: nucleotidyltransferase family protein [Clostridia bacterium]|nr:nucleotidyltransferase family protein [Clostridia bacterium]
MTEAFENMLYLLGAGARGYEIDATGMDMTKIREVAILQGVWPIVYKAAESTVNVNPWRSEFIFTMANSISRKEFTLSTIRKLEENGVRYCIMKGAAIAGLYALPECRISGDADIYINPDDEDKAIRILKENGYRVEERTKNNHHVRAVHPVGGLLEVHVRMYSKTAEEMVFDNKVKYTDSYVKTTIDGHEYNVMNPDDEILYLTAHYIKHLVNGGCGIRQILDLLLYIDKNKDKFDTEKYYKLMEELRYGKLLDIIKSVGGKYFGFDYPVTDEELVESFLTDTENGGTFGAFADDRKNFHSLYCKRRGVGSRMKNSVKLALKREKNIFYKLFPPRHELLKGGYGYAKFILLVPFAWVHRFFNIAFHRTRNRAEDRLSSEKALKRLELMKNLGMID